MSLVNYSDSEDGAESIKVAADDEQAAPSANGKSLKRKRRADDVSAQRVIKPPPALPSGFHALYSTNVRSSTSDDPSLHDGRQRQIPHVVGNWPSFVYLEWLPSEQNLVCLEEIVAEAAAEPGTNAKPSPPSTAIHSALRSDLGVRLPLHISLSSPLTLSTNNKDSFEQELTRAIKTANVSAFSSVPSGVRWVSNFERSRHFLILTLSKPDQDELQSLLSICNSVARNFEMPELYAQGSADVGVMNNLLQSDSLNDASTQRLADDMFHLSIAWTLAPPGETEKAFPQRLQQRLSEVEATFDSVYIKIGSRVSAIPLF